MATTASFLDILRYFTSEEQSPLDAIHWEKRDAVILGKDGAPVFEACGIEVPAFWSQRATDIVTSKYFRVVDSARETSVQRMIIRVVNTICWWGYADGYFDAETVKVFADELTHLLVHQYASFNSPVWFNVGVAEHPQSSACFVLDVEDSMESILEWYRQEGMIFKHGSGAGVNLSKIRAKGSSLSGGGKASGVMSFARVADTNAGAIKSGGTTRRAAKLLVLDVEHPEIEAFIQCKADAEKLARNLRQLGYSNGLEQGVTDMIPWQNANNSVNVSHEFMELATAYSALLQPDIRISEQVLLHKIAKAAWECGCPGLFFGETINTWHTTPTRGPIVSANPCMEVLQPPNTACNLASLNLLKFLKDDNTFDIPAFTHAIDIMITAMDILVDRSSYPTEAITKNSREYRPLGLGYANLGALLMSKGLPYDSNEGRGYAAAITALMTGEAYAQSARLAGIRGAFAGFEANQEEMQHVLHAHSQAVSAHFTGKESHHAQILTAAYNKWGDAAKVGEQYGYRNCQVSVLAPTGCLTPDALIPTDKGLLRLENMGNTEGAKWQDVDCAVMTDEGAQHATQFFVNGTNNVVQVTTTRGYQLCSTPVHRIKVFQDGEMIWKHASDLVSGDIVPLHLMQHHGEIQCVSLPDFPLSYHISENGQAPRVMSKELAEFIGAFMANGSWHEKGLRLHISTSDPDVAERIVSLARSLFDLDAHIEEHRDSACVTVCVNSTRLARWWYVCGFNKKQHGVARGKGYIAHIPDAILRTNDCAIYASFVRGVFDHDGTVQEGVPSFSNKDRHFVRDMQTLLLYLGYPTTLKRDIGGISGKPVYVVRLLNYTFVPSWKDEVGFYGERKSNLLSTKQKTYGKYDIIPITRELLNVVVPLQHPLRHDCTRHLRENQGLPRILAQRINDECPHPHLTFLLQFFYDTVEEVVLLDDRLTYDLSVPSNATYIANGFISHNTISFMMDCDTTGIEPCLGLVATKKLVGGGEVTLANQAVGRAMETLGYTGIGALAYFLEHPEENAGTWHILEKHRDVFACALSGELASGLRWDAISWQGHIKMVAAVQPFISGGISKTVNMPHESTEQDVFDAYVMAWKMGLKAIAIYRDGSKVVQPVTVGVQQQGLSSNGKEPLEVTHVGMPVRHRLPDERQSITHKFSLSGHEGYVTVGFYSDGTPGEVFVRMAKEGSTLGGLLDSWATIFSIALQHGIPLGNFTTKLKGTRYEPAGFTINKEIPIAQSITDYIAKWLDLKFGTKEHTEKTQESSQEASLAQASPLFVADSSAPSCGECGSLMLTRNGACFVCLNCGTSAGCS